MAREVADARPVLPRAFWWLWTITLVNRLGGFVVVLLSLYLTLERGRSAPFAGFVAAVYGVGGAVARSSAACSWTAWAGRASLLAWPIGSPNSSPKWVCCGTNGTTPSSPSPPYGPGMGVHRALPADRQVRPVHRAATAAVRGVALAVQDGRQWREMPGESVPGRPSTTDSGNGETPTSKPCWRG